jgi:hypothetical protein
MSHAETWSVWTGTNVRAVPSKSYPMGYLYPFIQEVAENFRHPRGGEWGYLRKSLQMARPRARRLIRRAFLGKKIRGAAE